MAEERWHKQLIEEAIDREQVLGLVEPRVRPAAKYKKDRHEDDSQPDLRVGMAAVIRVGGGGWRYGRGVRGYLLGIVLDWTEPEPGWWDRSSTVIVQIVDASQESLMGSVGHLRAAVAGGRWPGHMSIVAYGQGAWPSYDIKGRDG